MNDGPRPGNWGGIRSGRFEIYALGRPRDIVIDLDDFSVRMDMGGAGLTEVPDHLLPQALDAVRAVYPVEASTDEDLVEMVRSANAARMADGDYSCAFDSDTDPAGIPDGYGCGGCSCHMSAPCHHCMEHIAEDESQFIDTMLHLQGRVS